MADIPIPTDLSTYIFWGFVAAAAFILLSLWRAWRSPATPGAEIGDYVFELKGTPIRFGGLTTLAGSYIATHHFKTLDEIDGISDLKRFVEEGKLFVYGVREKTTEEMMSSTLGKALVVSTKDIQNPDYHDVLKRRLRLFPPSTIAEKRVICSPLSKYCGEASGFRLFFIDPEPTRNGAKQTILPDIKQETLVKLLAILSSAATKVEKEKSYLTLYEAEVKAHQKTRNMVAELQHQLDVALKALSNKPLDGAPAETISTLKKTGALGAVSIAAIGSLLAVQFLPRVVAVEPAVAALLGGLGFGLLYEWVSRRWKI